jgi:ribonuclease HI
MIKVFTDGSCINNGREGAKAGIGIYFGENDTKNVSRRIEGKQTNNTAEMKAVIEVFNILNNELLNDKKVIIYSDSEYVIRWCKDYGYKCSLNDWKRVKSNGKIEDIPNVELGRELYELYNNNENVEIEHVKSHTGLNDELSLGNNEADKLAYKSIGIEKNDNKLYKRNNKIYFNISYDNKEIAKKYGAKWNCRKKKWYYEGDHNDENFKKLIELFPN